MEARELAVASRRASRAVVRAGSVARQEALLRMADALIEREEEILAANALDREAAARDLAAGEISQSMADRLNLSSNRLQGLADGMRAVADMEEPIGRVLRATELADGLVLSQESSPLGVVLVIFESRPDVLPQLMSLALRSGNGLILKGGKEAIESNRVLHRVLTEAMAPLPGELFGLVETRSEVGEMLELDDIIDLVIPRGSNQLVRSIMERSRIPVLGHADGICHTYIDAAADPEMAARVAVDAKTNYPAACNALETLLIHRDYPAAEELLGKLRDAGVELSGGPLAVERFGLPAAPSMRIEYGSLAATVELVDGVEEAIDHIHTHGSGHTDVVITSDDEVAARFLDGVDSACVFHNASSRFADGFRFGLGAEVGVSTSRIHARGPVGVEGLLTTRWKLRGSGDTVGPFSSGERKFTHRPI